MFKHKVTWQILPYILMYLAALTLVALIDLVTADFQLDYILSAQYWSNVLTTALASLLVFLATAFYDVDKLCETDPRVVHDEAEIRKAIERDIDVDFKIYMEEDRLARKARAWVNKIIDRIRRLEMKSTTKKKTAKIKALGEQITDEYVEKYIESIKIKYYHVKMSQIVAGTHTKHEEDRLESGFGKIFRDVSPRYLLSISLPVFLASFVFESKTSTAVLLIKIASKIISLIMNYNNGRTYAKTYVNEVVLYNLNFRIKYIKEYLAWKLEKKKAGETLHEIYQLQGQHA